MNRKLLIATFYSAIVFCIVSYASVMISLLSSVGNPSQKPITNIGVPFKYYYQFWLSGSDSPNCGWNIQYFFIDGVIIWVLTTFIYLILNRKKELNG